MASIILLYSVYCMKKYGLLMGKKLETVSAPASSLCYSCKPSLGTISRTLLQVILHTPDERHFLSLFFYVVNFVQ